MRRILSPIDFGAPDAEDQVVAPILRLEHALTLLHVKRTKVLKVTTCSKLSDEIEDCLMDITVALGCDCSVEPRVTPPGGHDKQYKQPAAMAPEQRQGLYRRHYPRTILP